MHPGQLGGDRDHEDRRIVVDARRQFARHSFLLQLVAKSFARGLAASAASA